jgi:tRNA threonylcarbamoyladenosine biosynthesis protein TsaE
VSTRTTQTPEDMLHAGEEFAATLKPGDVVALCGNLGAGKTLLVQGIVRGLGSGDLVTSPTFTLINEYPSGRIPIVHADLYRMKSAEEAERAGLVELMDEESLTLVEWADKFPELIPQHARWVRIRILGSGEVREVEGLT